MVWTEKMRVSAHDIDLNGNVRPSLILRYMQEAANQQLHNLGPSNEDLRAGGKAFILCRVGVHNPVPLHAYDEITVETWACPSKLTSFTRCARIYRRDELVAEMMTVWALVDLSDRRLCRVEELKLNFDTEEPLELPFAIRLRLPKELELSAVSKRHIGYGDCDLNCHMNNTNYPDMLASCIDGIENKRVESFVISYIHEAPYDKDVSILMGSDGNDYFFSTQNEDGSVGVEARFTVSDIK